MKNQNTRSEKDETLLDDYVNQLAYRNIPDSEFDKIGNDYDLSTSSENRKEKQSQIVGYVEDESGEKHPIFGAEI